MALILKDVKIPVEADESSLKRFAARALAIHETRILDLKAVRVSLDARKKQDIHFNYTFRITLAAGEENMLLKKCAANIEKEDGYVRNEPVRGTKPRALPVAVIGFGPAGIFAAYRLAEYGCKPIIFERGYSGEKRVQAVQRFWDTGVLDTECNVMFGEGGAGTFSDGKLTTRIKDPRAHDVVALLAEYGAPQEITTQAKPHIGTDRLITTVMNMRRAIVDMGAEVRFGSRLTDIDIDNGEIKAVVIESGGVRERFECSACVLATGQGARDTYEMLCARGIELKAKPFAAGVRIEHPRTLIDEAQLGKLAGNPRLGAAEYRLTGKAGDRGVYTFCMCPGGVVVASSSADGEVVTNGMSYYDRGGQYSNAAIVVQVDQRDFGTDALAGMRFQQRLEEAAFRLGGGNFCAPAQRTEDFLKRRTGGFGTVTPSYKPGVRAADVADCLPEFMSAGIEAGIRDFAGKLKGFDYPDAVITAVESRTSSPVRIVRDTASGNAAGVAGLYPVGEGAGYAGGIVSAAVDGIKAADAILAVYKN